jgi:hypothetical protein
MALGGVVGLLLGVLYCRLILDINSAPIPIAFGFVLEAVFAALYARKHLGRPLTNDQRVRVSLGYTLGVALVLAPLTAAGWLPWSKPLLDRLEGLSGTRIGLALALAILGIACVALARYLVLALLAPIVAPAAPKRKHA